MEKQSKFELFKKHKIEGLQQIVGGHRPCYWASGPNKGRGDTMYSIQDNAHTPYHDYGAYWGIGDCVTAMVAPDGTTYDYYALPSEARFLAEG